MDESKRLDALSRADNGEQDGAVARDVVAHADVASASDRGGYEPAREKRRFSASSPRHARNTVGNRPTRRSAPQRRSDKPDAGRDSSRGKGRSARRKTVAELTGDAHRRGWRRLIPRTLKGRVAAIILIALVIGIATFNGAVAIDSVQDANYYDNPTREYQADLVDAAANAAIAATPDSANDAINKLREQLTGRSRWANDVIDAEQYWGMNTSAASTKLILAMIQVESGGNEHVDAVGNIMAVEQGVDEYNIIACGIPEANVQAGTPRASIFAGTKITRDALSTFVEFYGREADLSYHPQAALIAQGYNYGYRGWLGWCSDRGYTEWTLDASAAYQAAKMNGGGTVNHGQKVMDALAAIG